MDHELDQTMDADDLPDYDDQEMGFFLVVVEGPNPGQHYHIPENPVLLGRHASCDICLPEKRVSGQHCRFTKEQGTIYVEDLGSRNGTFVDEVRITEKTPLTLTSNLLVGHTLMRVVCRSESELQRQNELFQKATTDALTNISNRHSFEQDAEKIISFSARNGLPVTALIMDADHFKKVNDTYGHLGGDEVLKFLGRTLREQKRTEDLAARYGGEEFVALLPNTTSVQAMPVAERIRTTVEAAEIHHEGQAIKVTLSIGLYSCVATEEETVETMIAKADEALYHAKESGRNRVCEYDPGLGA